MRIAVRQFVLLAAVTTSAWGSDGGAAEGKSQVQELKNEVLSLRQELATAKLELGRALRELRELREFLASEDAAGQAEQWRRERHELADERRKLEAERRRLENERRRVERATVAGQGKPAAGGPEAGKPDPQQPQYQLDYKLAYIRTVPGRRPIYVEFGDLLIPAEAPAPEFERERVMMRGTIQNRSRKAWRYTFEIRLGDRTGNILGRWRYQTPVLAPNELHPFDIEVPVSDAMLIDRYQIGKIEADQPPE